MTMLTVDDLASTLRLTRSQAARAMYEIGVTAVGPCPLISEGAFDAWACGPDRALPLRKLHGTPFPWERTPLAAKADLGRSVAALARRAARQEESAPEDLGDADSVVYFVAARAGGPIKIGTTRNLRERVATFQIGCPVELVVMAVIRRAGPFEEFKLHTRFAPHRLHGEWFTPAPELLELIDLLRKEAAE